MLAKLSVKNYALIESLEIDFSSGFSVFTGETGSGKSILMGALQLLIGERADFKSLFNKNQKCIVEGVFSSVNFLSELLLVNDLDVYKELIIRREIHPTGKSRAFVNDTPVKLEVLKQIGFLLIDFHGQHQTRLLSVPDYQYSFIDNVGKTSSVLKKYRQVFINYSKKKKQLQELIQKEQSINNKKEFLSFQLQELSKYSFENWDEDAINKEYELLSNFESVKLLFDQINQYNSGEQAIVPKLNTLVALISDLGKKLSDFQEFESRANSIYLELNELFVDLSKKHPDADFDPYKMEQLNEKLLVINSLSKKFNVDSLAGLIQKKQEILAELSSFEGVVEEKNHLQRQVDSLYQDCISIGQQLYKTRLENNPNIENYLSSTLHKLSMPNVKIKIELLPTDKPHSFGIDTLCIKVSLNKGSNFSAIGDVASGGEMSRILLSMKSLINKENAVPTIIFDEIDTGVSGKVANEVGFLLKDLSINSQVFSITHLPQVASMGSCHFKVEKNENEYRTYTTISKLDKESRVLEIATMLGGTSPGKAAIDNASELLN